MAFGDNTLGIGLSVISVLFLALESEPVRHESYNLGFLLNYNKHPPTHFDDLFFLSEIYAPVILYALEKIKKDTSLLQNVTLNMIWNDTECNELVAIQQQVWQLNKRVDAFFGPGCQCDTAARIAAAFNKPLFSYKCRSSDLVDKDRFPTVARTSNNDIYISPPLITLLKHFKWKRVGIVVESGTKWQTEIVKYLTSELEKSGVMISKVQTIDFHAHDDIENQILEHVKQIPEHARIVILLMSLLYVREFLVVAQNEGLVSSGEYVFIGFKLNTDGKYLQETSFKLYWSKVDFSKGPTKRRMESFGSFLLLTKRPVNTYKYKEFQDAVKELAGKGNHSFRHERYHSGCPKSFVENRTVIKCVKNSSVKGSGCLEYENRTETVCKRSVPESGARLFDAIYQYAYALNSTLAKNIAPNGTNIINELRGHTFDSIFGYKMTFNNNSDVIFNMSLYTQQYVNGSKSNSSCDPFKKYEPCLVFKRTADFVVEPGSPYKQVYQQRPGFGLWRSSQGKIPLDSPKCGFKNEFCPPDKISNRTIVVVLSVSGGIAALVLFLIFHVYRQYRTEQRLQSLLWKIDYEDISYDRRRLSDVSIESGIIGSFLQENTSSSTETQREDYQPTDGLLGRRNTHHYPMKFTTVGLYRDNCVAIKKLSIKNVDMTRTVLKELNLMRQVLHDNLNGFFGACVEPWSVCIVTSYCSKGSLQDILENQDVRLDNMFILSLLYDTVKGLSYLHDSEIKVHGNLKSTNCVVDNRWQLKLTDYGLTTFKSKQLRSYSCQHAYYRDMLWKAPELLRSSSANKSCTQKGDVYSFGIILQEIHTRKGPYSHNFDELKDILERVKAMEFPPYRPVMPDLIPGLEELRELAKECWSDLPQERPTSSELKKRIHKMLVSNKMKTNILDNMIYMMEKYTDNLEELVVERTGQLIEEKKKTDALLERMLPHSVAEQLKKGKSVEAESFSCVTIYFSDIVSFTELCAESTPLQVVSMLNDLYTLFDEIIGDFDVYKVETIGDAYMVVSGLPQRNEDFHASEICCMAVRIRNSVHDFKIRHKPNYRLKLRIGIHSGPVVAGVVGRTMPRYCLFGDTVNTASRLESSGEALRIHISCSTKDILDKLSGFHTEERGEIPLKGKGLLMTYWLVQADASVPRSPCREINHASPDFFLQEFHQSQRSFRGSIPNSLRGSVRGSFRNASFMNQHDDQVTRNSPVIERWTKQTGDVSLA